MPRKLTTKQGSLRVMAARLANTRSYDTANIAAWIFFTVLAVLAAIGLIVTAVTAVEGHHIAPLIIGPISMLYLLWCGYMLYLGIIGDQGGSRNTVYLETMQAFHSLTPDLQVHAEPLMREVASMVNKGVILTPHDSRVTAIRDLSDHKLAMRGREHVDTINRLIQGLDEMDSGTRELKS